MKKIYLLAALSIFSFLCSMEELNKNNASEKITFVGPNAYEEVAKFGLDDFKPLTIPNSRVHGRVHNGVFRIALKWFTSGDEIEKIASTKDENKLKKIVVIVQLPHKATRHQRDWTRNTFEKFGYYITFKKYGRMCAIYPCPDSNLKAQKKFKTEICEKKE